MKTLTVDDYQRVRLPDAKPRTKFAYEDHGNGTIVLTELAPVESRPNRVRFEKRRGRTVGVIEGAKFDPKALKKALAEFP